MDPIIIPVVLLDEAAQLPQYAYEDDAGADVFSVERATLEVGQMVPIRAAISVEIPVGYEIQVRSKSGLAAKHQIFVINSPGTVDCGYRGEVLVLLINLGKSAYTICSGDKIGQFVLAPVVKAKYVKADKLSDSARGEGGFGSTGQ